MTMATRCVLLSLLLAGARAGCGIRPSPKSGNPLAVTACAPAMAEGQEWVLPDKAGGAIHLKVTYVEGLCFDAGKGTPESNVEIKACDPARKDAQTFRVVSAGGTVGAVHLVHNKSSLCVNFRSPHDHPSKSRGMVDLYTCGAGQSRRGNGDDRWKVVPGQGDHLVPYLHTKECLDACGGSSPSPPGPPHPQPPPSPPGPPPLPADSVVTLADRYSPFTYEGVWAMSANGAARLLFEYPEPTRSQILDTMFAAGQGTRWQGLKIEIGGDVESSYGSMSSYAHVANKSTWSFHRGVQWWLMKEAKKRNPHIPLMALSWGMPAWVGGGKTLSQGGVDYHVQYILGAKRVHNLTIDWIGIWNEAPWTADYIILLRKGLDEAGLQHVKITAADGGTDVISAAAKSAPLAAAIDSFGIHTHVLSPDQDINNWNGRKMYWNTENDLVDGALPQWGPSMQSSLNWPLAFINNFLLGNGTATMLCPAFHGWSMNLGRHNHGPAFFNDPWSGFYQLGAPFFTQAQFTQFTEIGWRFIEGGSGRIGCRAGATANHAGMPICNLTFAALASPSGDEFSLVVVALANTSQTLRIALAGALATFAGTPLRQWSSTEHSYFKQQQNVTIPKGASLVLNIPAKSVLTISNRVSPVGWAGYEVPQRTRFPMPYQPAWEQQPIDAPCLGSNPIFGAFEVAEAGDGGARFCRQAVPMKPGGNAWTHRHNGWPITTLPSGSNHANVIVSVEAQMLPTQDSAAAVSVCGRVPIWSPAACPGRSGYMEFALGICLTVMAPGGVSSWPSLHQEHQELLNWRITEAQGEYHGCQNFKILATGSLPAGAKVEDWRTLALSFSDGTVDAAIDGATVAKGLSVVQPAGVAGFGTAWNIGHFKNLSVAANPKHKQQEHSFIFDVLPSIVTWNNYTGWAGFILDLSKDNLGNSFPTVKVSQLGRFKSVNNSRVHSLAIFRRDDGTQMGATLSVDMVACVTDMLGFCYSSFDEPVTLAHDDIYYIVSSEEDGGDSFVEMTKSATGADYSTYRDGDTLMTYRLPTGAGSAPMAAGRSLVVGKVLGETTEPGRPQWTEHTSGPDMDTSFGPVNMVLANSETIRMKTEDEVVSGGHTSATRSQWHELLSDEAGDTVTS